MLNPGREVGGRFGGATARYRYDALYRLISAEGREHIGQATQPETTWDDRFRTHLPHPHDGQAMRRYVESYHYDGAGNLLHLQHQAQGTGWTRGYIYGEASQLEPAKYSNRLSTTAVGNATEAYSYDAHGNTTAMAHLSGLTWNFLDQLAATSCQVVISGPPETTYYTYDAAGTRTRKVTERPNGTRKHERIYVNGFELFREYDATGDRVTLERETLHVMTSERIALIETRTQGTDPGPAHLIRYQFTTHLRSASLELDGLGDVISYEEYFPYGSTSYQAVRSHTQAPKQYRYTGMERDEESGFSLHGVRYYAPWIARWTGCDPLGISGGLNQFAYAGGNPVSLTDTSGMSPEGDDQYRDRDNPAYYTAPPELIEVSGSAPLTGRISLAPPISEREYVPLYEAALVAEAAAHGFTMADRVEYYRTMPEVGENEYSAGFDASYKRNVLDPRDAAEKGAFSRMRNTSRVTQAAVATLFAIATLITSAPVAATTAVKAQPAAYSIVSTAQTSAPIALGAQLALGVVAPPGVDIPLSPVDDAGRVLRQVADRGTDDAIRIFFRGTTYRDAVEVVENQALNATRIAGHQAANPGAAGSGAYITSQFATAHHYAQLAGLFGRAGGPGILRLEVMAADFATFAARHGLEIETVIPRGPFPGSTETLIPQSLVEDFSAIARCFMHES